MRKSLLLCLSLLLLSSCEPGGANEDYSDCKMVDVTLQKSKISTNTINPFIYGTFIEHIDTCIYNGIWGEIIKDRKFYKPVNEDVSQWYKASGTPSMDTMTPFEGEYSLVLSSGDSVRQNAISLDKDVSYDGYVYAKGTGKLSIKYNLNDENIETILDVNSNDYTKLTYKIKSSFQSKKAKLFISCIEGKVTIDSVSLNRSDNINGMRKDTLDLLKELNSPFYRWPGGNFVSGYDFYDGIGPRDLRPTKRNLNYTGLESSFATDEERLANDLIKIGSLGFYGAFDSNDFGIEEFLDMCKYINAEPNIVLNSGLGDVNQARDEIEFLNSNEGKYSKLRSQKEPYGVKYFSIGNEMNGDWQLGHTDISTYAKKHNQFASAIKSIDSSIKIIGVGDNHSSWSQEMVNRCKGNIDLLSEHFYAERKETNIKDHILSLKEQGTYRIKKHRDLKNAGNITMAIDEYAYNNAEQPSRLKDGMGVASLLNEFIVNSDVVDIACYSSTVNATQGNLITDNFNSYLEGSGYALSLYRNNMQNHYLPVSYKGGKNDDYYEIFATINDKRDEISLSVINTLSQKLALNCADFKEIIKEDRVTGRDFESINNATRTELKRTIHTKDFMKKVVAEPLSISVFKIKI